MKKIEKLTEEQEKYMAEFRQKWTDIGLCCEPANFDVAEEQITLFYKKLGKKKPMFFRFSSPLACEFGIVFIEEIFKLLNGKKKVRAQVRDQVGDQVGAQVWAQVRDQVWAQVGAQVGDQVRDQVRDQVWAQVGAQVMDQVKNTKFLDNALWGQHEANWVAFYKFFQEIGVKYREDDNLKLLNAWGALSESACWWAPWENVCIICDRPKLISRDDQNRIHNETGMAVEFRDGWGIYAWHGTRIPAEWITDKNSLTAKTALTWKNIEQRRSACEILTWGKVLDELKAKVLDTDDDEQIGELVEVEIPDIGKEKFLRVICGTGRKFAIPVPPEMKTALEANSWTYGIDGNTLKKLEVRT